VSVTVGIPFSRWGAEPFILAPIPFPLKALESARVDPRPKGEGYPHPFELALMWKKQLADEQTLTKSKIAAREGLSRARVTQIMNLLELPNCIKRQLEDPPEPLNIHAFSERRLRMILSRKIEEQMPVWTAWVRELQSVFGPS
jgi:hypothetical protein